MAETVIFLVILFLALLATIIPVAVQAGLTHLKLTDTEASVNTLAQFLAEHLTLTLWTLGVLFVVSGILLAIHCLVVAGSLRTYLEAERAAVAGPIDRFYAFRLDAFWEAATDGFWRVFWIYNLAWGLAGVIATLPLMLGLMVMVLLTNPGASMMLGFFCFAGTVLLFIPVGFVTTIWVNRALVEGARQDLGARAALAAARVAIRADLATHAIVTFLVIVISIGGAAFVGNAAGVFSGADNILAPLRFIAWLAQTFASALGSAWMLTAFAAISCSKSSS
jgi:hypothetical protein